MKIKHLFGIIIAASALTACSDDMAHRGDNSPSRQNGFQYFNIREGGDWKDDKASTRSFAEAPIRLKTELKNAEPIYLHTDVVPTSAAVQKEKVAETRGRRYTGEVFTSGISDLAVYGKNNNEVDIFAPFQQFYIGGSEENNRLTSNEDWYVKGYSDSEWKVLWKGGTTGKFYAYAPYFAYDAASNSNGLRSYMDGGVPKIEYDVPPTVGDQLDLLTAYNPSANNGNSIDLEFEHVLSAIKFQIKDKDGSHHTWKVNKTDYNVTVTSIKINSVWAKGTWDFSTKTWTGDGTTKKSFELDCTDKNWSAASPTGTDLMDDSNVFMMMPQTLPARATVSLMCTLTADGKTPIETSMNASIGGKIWEPGHTYTYIISLEAFTYFFDYYDESTEKGTDTKTYNNFTYNGGDAESGIFIRSYKIDENKQKTIVDWKMQYQETSTSVTGVGGGGSDQTSWKDGSNGWILLYDHSTGDYATEVKKANSNDPHGGAEENSGDNIKLFKIAIRGIMDPIIDLSLWNQDQTKRWKRSTSNCYIVAGPGTYRIPLIYGNAWTNGQWNESAYRTNNSGGQILSTFRNCNDEAIGSPFINKDGSLQVDHAILIWEEGVGKNGNVTQALRQSYGGGTGTSASGPYKINANIGTVVKVHWDIDKSITGEDPYNTNSGNFEEDANYLKFEIDPANFNYGNAVVGICDSSGKILWSWHIWITDPTTFLNGYDMNIDNHPVTFAGTNIGWVDASATTKAAQTREGHVRLLQKESGKEIYINVTQKKSEDYKPYFTNVLYQWGRKDPMRGNVDINDNGEDYGAPRGASGIAYSNNFNNTATVGTLIKNPNSIYGLSDGDLYPFAFSYSNLWSMNISGTYQSTWGTWKFDGKTIYDPSPVGYCVPPSRYLMTFARSSLLNPSKNWANGFDDINPSSATFPIKARYYKAGVNQGGDMYFPASGLRSTTSGFDLKARGYVKSPAALGFYHTSTAYSRDESFQLHNYYYPGAAVDTHTKILGDMCEALSVLPVVWNGEAGTDTDPSTQYLTFTFASAGNLYWMKDDAGTDDRPIYYSTDNGATWSSAMAPGTTKLSSNNRINVSAGSKVLVKGNNNTYCKKTTTLGVTNYHYCYFESDAPYELSGNIMSLFYGDSYQNQTSFPGETYNLCRIFYTTKAGTNKNQNLEDISDLVLPATTLTESCYESMFEDCYNIGSAPNLPATTGGDANNCYKEMFQGCTNLTFVKVMLDPDGTTNYTSNWLDGVASAGTFFFKSGADWVQNSASGIPQDWNAIELSE